MSSQPTEVLPVGTVPRVTATVVLLVLCGVARVVGVLSGGGVEESLPLAVALAGVEVLLPFVLAGLDMSRRPPAPAATLALAALGAGQLMAVGIDSMLAPRPLGLPLVAQLVSAGLAMLAGAIVIGRWQDQQAPSAGPGPRPARTAAVLGALLLSASLVTTPVAVLGRITLGGGAELPGPVALAMTLTPSRLPLVLVVLLAVGWAATRADRVALRAVSLVLATRALAHLGADLSIQAIGPTPLLLLLSGGSVVLLLVAGLTKPRRPQVTSSST